MNMREAAAALRRGASEAHQVSARLEGRDLGPAATSEALAIARDVGAIAWSLERYADVADRIADRAGETGPHASFAVVADPATAWPVDHEYHDG